MPFDVAHCSQVAIYNGAVQTIDLEGQPRLSIFCAYSREPASRTAISFCLTFIIDDSILGIMQEANSVSSHFIAPCFSPM